MKAKPADIGDGRIQVHFWCPGCDRVHGVYQGPPAGWEWNGSTESPTFSPSVLVQPHKTLLHEGDVDELPPSEWRVGMTPLCHSFVREGRIEFLSDSTHALAGQTVDLPDWPYAP